ncbi:MAG: cupin domain-containing protein [Fibrobacteres bacterium]|nr:cupin domain-containing protein [Fibrobacterota bacterium]
MVVKGSELPYDAKGRKLLSYGGSLMMVEVPIGKMEASPSLHSHPHEQISYILKGSFKFFYGDKIDTLKQGDSIYLSPSLPHGVQSLEEGSVILDVFTPQRNDFLQ